MSVNSFKQIRVPPDHILVNEKWMGTKLGQELTQKHGGIYSNEIGLADFFPADKLPVLYFNQTSYQAKDFKIRLKKFYDAFKTNCTVLADRNTKTINDFTVVQDFATFSLNLDVIPVIGPQDVPLILKDLGRMESQQNPNPFSVPTGEAEDLSSKQLGLLTLIPNLGRKKSQDLLAKMGHIQAIAEASEQQIASVVGQSAAKSVYNFFHGKYKVQ